MKKRIVIVDDHSSLREMLVMVLSRKTCYEIVGQTGFGRSAVSLCRVHHPDVVILDLLMPELSGIEILRRVRLAVPQVRVLIYSGTCNRNLIIEALKCRPHGFVDKSASLETLCSAIDAVVSGASYFTPFATRLFSDSLGESCNYSILSEREREVFQMVAEGLSSKEISSRLNVAVKTVENHRAHIMQKLCLRDVASLTRYAVKLGVVSVD